MAELAEPSYGGVPGRQYGSSFVAPTDCHHTVPRSANGVIMDSVTPLPCRAWALTPSSDKPGLGFRLAVFKVQLSHRACQAWLMVPGLHLDAQLPEIKRGIIERVLKLMRATVDGWHTLHRTLRTSDSQRVGQPTLSRM